MSPQRTPIEERFWPKVRKTATCWEWTGRLWNGYGVISRGGKNGAPVATHRLAYELLVGPIPSGLTIDHLCRNRGCVNPSHLEPVTIAENTMRGESPLAKKARQTHCQNGHPFDDKNTRWTKNCGRATFRVCRTCANASASIRLKASVTHCPNGHLYSPENTRIIANGNRRCVTCLSARRISSTKWSMTYPCCVICGTTDRPHKSKGQCSPCYQRVHAKGATGTRLLDGLLDAYLPNRDAELDEITDSEDYARLDAEERWTA